MKVKALLIILSLVGTVSSCTNESENTEATIQKNPLGLVLNEGEKWQSNPETQEGMQQIKTILENMDPITLDDYILLGEKCDEQTTYIISNCSMDGEAHNQLHNVLHPILDNIDALLNSKSKDEGKKAMHQLETNIGYYFKYFDA